MRTDEKTVIRISVAVGIASLLVYLGSLSCGFINLDDPFYITNNSLIKSLDLHALRRIFTEAHLGAWLPLTYLSFAIDYHFWGDNPTGYHLTNIILHAANASLVVLLADRLLTCCREALGEGGYCYPLVLLLAGLLWGLHPLRVESVAWAAERKDVLNGFFTLATVLAYLRYARGKEAGTGNNSIVPYLLALACFISSLLAKQVSVTLPVVMLLLDWYPLGRFKKERVASLLLEKIPFFAVAIFITMLTIYFAASEKYMASLQDMPFYVRVLVSGNAIFEYCRFMLFPVGISPYFVLPKPLPYGYLVKTVVVATATLLLWRFSKAKQAIAASWFAFVILFSPMLAFVQTGDDIAMATRYTYLPAIALSIAVAAALVLFSRRLPPQGRRLLAIALAFFLVINVGITLKLIKVWQDTGTFWSRVIEIEPVGRAYGDRGVYYLINRKSAAAVEDFNVAIAIAEKAGVRSIYNLYAFRGVALGDIGSFAEAVTDFDRAIALYQHPTYFYQRGVALKALGRTAEAEMDFRRAGPNPPPIDWF
ncbi:hypothetical protein KI809_19750 [Geobacter pelophilus]|uniref:Tetratricopeptide repeat-containing protein n=1 Tax=Geoanaerobacter pelophilus TaxID=60036 RepID=A0AAW4LDC7_9BACT|nr:hypothetical protein [Geoanaerobacter pelophilus]MBT0666550.1 hypothetical protein [Geoanaerobacter pelophilus]